MSLLPSAVRALLAASLHDLPVSDIAATSGGFSNLTVLATIGVRRCAVKAANTSLKRADLRREARVLSLLQGFGLRVPSLISLCEDATWTVVVLEAVGGMHGLQLLTHAPNTLALVYCSLGRLLAAIHQVRLEPIGPALLVSSRIDEAARLLPMRGLEGAEYQRLIACLEHPIWRTPPAGLVHGDVGLHNILWDGTISALLDWECAGVGPQLLDLAWLWWTMQWRGLSPDLWEAFLVGYGAGSALHAGASEDVLLALTLSQIACFLVRSRDQPLAWSEWLRRLRWT